jgi:hypothetical protein
MWRAAALDVRNIVRTAVITGLQDLADAVNMQGTVGVVNLSLGHPVTES